MNDSMKGEIVIDRIIIVIKRVRIRIMDHVRVRILENVRFRFIIEARIKCIEVNGNRDK